MIKIDASSLIIALKIGFIEILKKLYGELVITQAVYEEVVKQGKGRGDAIICETLVDKNEITVHQINKKIRELGLGIGETEVIHNSIELNCSCMMEDKKAKKIAESFHLDVRRIPISMLEAYKQNVIDDSKFERHLAKWIRYGNPSYEEIYFVKKIKEVL